MKFFMKRVQKLDNMRNVSRREHKLIRKLLRSSKKNGEFDWNEILFHFPGKRMQELKDYTIRNFARYFQINGEESNLRVKDSQSKKNKTK